MILLDPLARPVVAHRGASGRFPENTHRAFREAQATGADAIELDVRLSRDGVAVVIHDESVDRTTDGAGKVADLTLADLQALDAGAGERIPTLAEVLETYREVPLIVEIKEVAAAQGALKLIERMEAGSRVLVGSFLHKALAPFRRAPCATAASRRQTAAFWAASRVWSRGLGGAYQAFTVPEHSGNVHVVDERFVGAAVRAKKPVHVWTVDDVATAERLRAIGVAGIITNFPDRMGTLLS